MPSQSEDDTAEARAAVRLDMLRELAAMGMDLARAVHRDAMAPPADGEAPKDPVVSAQVFSRINLAVRQTLALEVRLVSDLRLLGALAAEAEDELQRDHARQVHLQRKAQLREIVQAVIVADRPDYVADLVTHRLDACLEAADDHFTRLPLGEAVARLCRDLSLRPPRRKVDWEARVEDKPARYGRDAPYPAGPPPTPDHPS